MVVCSNIVLVMFFTFGIKVSHPRMILFLCLLDGLLVHPQWFETNSISNDFMVCINQLPGKTFFTKNQIPLVGSCFGRFESSLC